MTMQKRDGESLPEKAAEAVQTARLRAKEAMPDVVGRVTGLALGDAEHERDQIAAARLLGDWSAMAPPRGEQGDGPVTIIVEVRITNGDPARVQVPIEVQPAAEEEEA